MEKENLIYSMTFELEVPASMGKDAAMDEVESCCDTYIIPVVDEVVSRFGKLYDADVDSIELDLGTVAKEEMPKVLKSMLEDEMIRKLYHESNGVRMISTLCGDEVCENGESSRQFLNYSDNLAERRPFIVDGKPYQVAFGFASGLSNEFNFGWMSYLFTGEIPWFFVDAETDLCQQLRRDVSGRLCDRAWLILFLTFLTNADASFYRFVNLLDTDGLRELLDAVLFDESVEQSASLNVPEDKRTGYAGSVFESSLLDKRQLSAMLYYWTKHHDELTKQQMEDVLKTLLPLPFGKDSGAATNVGFEMKTGEDGFMDRKNLEISRTTIQMDPIDEHMTLAKEIQTYEERVALMKQNLMENYKPEESRCLADDAGLVILHPFLTNLFDRLGYLDEKQKFVNLVSQERAVHLLRWLAGFSFPHYDYQLPLEKILCDLPLAYPIDSEIELTDLEKEEGMQVLQSVCHYWTPLNGTSPEGLQQSFMRRDAKVVFEDGAWIVMVEGQAMDILLDDLPWEISLLLFPWKKDMIMVEWQR